MASKDFENLMDLLFKKGQRIEKVTTNLNDTGPAHISFIGSADTFSSKEPDVVKYTLHLRHTIDSDGNYELVGCQSSIEGYKQLEQIGWMIDS